MTSPIDLRPKQIVRPDGGKSVQHFVPMKELTTSSGYWLQRLKPSSVLTLTGINPSVKIDNDYLVITPGSTLAELSPTPSKYARAVHGLIWIVIDSNSGFVTVDAIHWLESQKIGLMICSGKDALIVLQHIHKPIVTLRRKQYSRTPINVARWILSGKLNACINVVPELIDTPEFHNVLYENGLDRCSSIDELRLLEGRAAGVYWRYYRFNLTHYVKFPSWWAEFTQRSSAIGSGNRWATHPINAILNYGYAIVASMIKRECILIGLDTAIGSLHADSNRRDSLVYDLLEFLRADIDSMLITWAKSVKWRRTDFKTSIKGVVSLDNNLRKVVATKIIIFNGPAKQIVKSYVLFLLNSQS